jgi:L-lactate utilization protein LutB
MLEDANMDAANNDRSCRAARRRFCAIMEEMPRLMSLLEERRKAAELAGGEFYHVRSDSEHAQDVIRTVTLKKEMDFLMSLAEGWARGDIIRLDTPAD